MSRGTKFCDYSHSSAMMLCGPHLISISKSLQLSDLDARVLDELLKDPRLLESLVEQRVQLEGGAGDDDEYEGAKNITDVVNKPPTERGLAVGGEMARGEKRSVYESVTMQVVEELQDSARGFFAKIAAAFESAGDTSLLLELVTRFRQQSHHKHGVNIGLKLSRGRY